MKQQSKNFDDMLAEMLDDIKEANKLIEFVAVETKKKELMDNLMNDYKNGLKHSFLMGLFTGVSAVIILHLILSLIIN